MYPNLCGRFERGSERGIGYVSKHLIYFIVIHFLQVKVKVKVKHYLYKSGQAQRVPRV